MAQSLLVVGDLPVSELAAVHVCADVHVLFSVRGRFLLVGAAFPFKLAVAFSAAFVALWRALSCAFFAFSSSLFAFSSAFLALLQPSVSFPTHVPASSSLSQAFFFPFLPCPAVSFFLSPPNTQGIPYW